MANRHMKRCTVSLVVREIHIKRATKHHLTPVRIVTIKKFANKSWAGHRGKQILHTVGGSEIGAATKENNMKLSPKTKNRVTI